MLVPCHNHKFKLYEGERLDDMVSSVKANGIFTPILVRAVENGEKYEILSGHNRTNAARLAGLTHIPAIVKENLSDDEAEFRSFAKKNAHIYENGIVFDLEN